MERSGKDAVGADRVRELLRQVLPGPREVAAFCADQFPHLRAGLTAGRSAGAADAGERDRQVELLLAQVSDRQEIVARLRAFAPNAAAWGPRRAVWPYVLCALAICTALLGGFLAWRMTMARRPQSRSAPAGAPGAARAAGAAALLPCSEPCYGARHKEAPCRPTACRFDPPGSWRDQAALPSTGSRAAAA